MRKAFTSFSVMLIFFFLLSSSAFSALKVLIVYASQYKAEAVIDLSLAEKDAMNFKEAISSFPKLR
ncbi:MAG: hypothetical protein J7L52_07700 [Thermotogae bacterium]|nr:hypothetical protein [Thermotogota bacterium]